jgi:protein-ribulosamine 3-kinase
MLPSSLHTEITAILSQKTGADISIRSISSLSGGSINNAYRLETNADTYFMKYNRASAYPGMFQQEARGLELLLKAKAIRVPEVIAYGEAGNDTFILLEYLDSSGKGSHFWEDFAHNLAALHKNTSDQFGLDHDNYIGSLKQYNDVKDRWVDFFIVQRLLVQMDLAGNSGLMPASTRQAFERLFKRLDEIFPIEPPSLIHGDLWGGNFMVDEKGKAAIIDPAVYYGFREMDIGMSQLFGGFDSAFYTAYNNAWPMEPGWRERIDICNLYPLMVHVNLFGTGYLGSVDAILQRF